MAEDPALTAQQIRLVIMMYRQGWLDATEYLHRETLRRAHSIKKQYNELYNQYPLPKKE